MTVRIKIAPLTQFIPLFQDFIPKKQSPGAAAYDLASSVDFDIGPHETQVVPTGIRMALPQNYAGMVCSRSGLAANGIVVANAPGIIDSDYRGEVKVILHNLTDEKRLFNIGDRIAQLIVIPLEHINFITTKDLNITERGTHGFGSTGF